MGRTRAVVLVGVLALSGASLVGLERPRPIAIPAVAAPVPAAASAPAPRAVRPGSWSVVIDGWYIELDNVAGLRVPALDPERLEPPLLSPYDDLIATYAEAAAIDWRLIAAVIYEESRFIPDSISSAGAYGLMQIMPIAAREMGEEKFRDPEDNIRTGVRYLERLQKEYGSARDRDRQALALAAYNMGLGHLQDAQALARRFGYDPLRWDGAMDVMVSLLEEPQIYEQLPLGYAQGRSVVDYVDRVLRRFSAYRRDLPAVPPRRLARTATITQ